MQCIGLKIRHIKFIVSQYCFVNFIVLLVIADIHSLFLLLFFFILHSLSNGLYQLFHSIISVIHNLSFYTKEINTEKGEVFRI